jgi:hypothetical protein
MDFWKNVQAAAEKAAIAAKDLGKKGLVSLCPALPPPATSSLLRSPVTA